MSSENPNTKKSTNLASVRLSPEHLAKARELGMNNSEYLNHYVANMSQNVASLNERILNLEKIQNKEGLSGPEIEKEVTSRITSKEKQEFEAKSKELEQLVAKLKKKLKSAKKQITEKDNSLGVIKVIEQIAPAIGMGIAAKFPEAGQALAGFMGAGNTAQPPADTTATDFYNTFTSLFPTQEVYDKVMALISEIHKKPEMLDELIVIAKSKNT